jgi:hypothetical protein
MPMPPPTDADQGARTPLNRERILRAAVAQADEHGTFSSTHTLTDASPTPAASTSRTLGVGTPRARTASSAQRSPSNRGSASHGHREIARPWVAASG